MPEQTPSFPPPPRIGVALSGGGHRAALFTLGALLYLIDAGQGPRLAAVTSVSGGSITNGVAGLGDLHVETCDQFRDRMRPLARACATTGTLFAGGLTVTYLFGVAVVLLGGLAAAFRAGGWWAVLLSLITLLVVGRLLMLRGWLPEITLGRALLKGKRLADLNTGLDHVLCATDLQTAEHVYFSGGWIRSYRLGVGRPGVSLARAVSSSAAFPGGFYPRRLFIKNLGFREPKIPSMLLSDGGVYDNMGTEWFLHHNPGDPASRQVDELVVVNASAPLGLTKRKLIGIPLIGEFAELMAVLMTTYDQTTAVRRRWIMRKFRDPGEHLTGALIPIERSPLYLAQQFSAGDDASAQRAIAVLGHLSGEGPDAWAASAKAAADVPTNLNALGAPVAANLLRHGYVLTMANTHVLLGYPLLKIPDLGELEAWVR